MVRVAIIGAGLMGRTHLAAYKTMDNAQVTAVCDLNEEQGRALAAEAGCAWYGDGGAMLAEAGVDVVDSCLPTFLHEQYALLAAAHKKHILCAKPVTLDLVSFARVAGAAALTDNTGSFPGEGRAMMADAAATCAGALLGVTTEPTMAESAVGVHEGARTGLCPVVTGQLFLLALPFAPLAGAIPGAATAAAVIIVGMMMMSGISQMTW